MLQHYRNLKFSDHSGEQSLMAKTGNLVLIKENMKRYHSEIHRVNVKNLFDSKAPKWTSKYQNKLYHRINAFISALKKPCPPGSAVLDFGCGSGVLTLKAIESGYNVFGIDISDQMIKEGTHKLQFSL